MTSKLYIVLFTTNTFLIKQIKIYSEHTWKCLVLPGVTETGTFLVCSIALIVELFPTFG